MLHFTVFEFCREKSLKLIDKLCIVHLILSSREEWMLCYFHIKLNVGLRCILLTLIEYINACGWKLETKSTVYI